MNKSTRPMPPQGLNSDRRYSQPAMAGGPEHQRKGPRYSVDVGPSGPGMGAMPGAIPGAMPGAMPGPMEDKLSAEKGGFPPSRKTTRVKDGPEMDPENRNPDGSLKMAFRLPSVNESFYQAGRARYVRRSSPAEWETTLSVQQVFEK